MKIHPPAFKTRKPNFYDGSAYCDLDGYAFGGECTCMRRTALQPSTDALSPSNGSRNVATVWDVSADYQVSRFLTATAYFGRASGAGVIAGIYPKDTSAQLAYIETTVHF